MAKPELEFFPVENVDLTPCAGQLSPLPVVNLTFWRLNTGPHAVTAGLVSPAVTGWVADRLAGRSTGSNC